jgi:hypothetical protein
MEDFQLFQVFDTTQPQVVPIAISGKPLVSCL